MGEQNIEITLVPANLINEEKNNIRISCNYNNSSIVAWGETLLEAINKFDDKLLQLQNN